MASALGFAITATDQTAAAFERVNTRIEAFQKKTQTRMDAVMAPVRRLQTAMARFGDVSGINRVGGALRGVARAGTEAYQRVGQLVPLIGIVGSAASVAGVTRMVEAWTALGSRAGFAAQRIGISAGQLTAFQGAGRLAGASADGVTSGLQALGQTMYDALGGRAPEAVVMFRTLGISFSDAAGHAKSVTEVLPQVADKIAAIRNPFAQAQVATTLFGGAAEELLPFLRRGSDGIRDYVLTAERYGAISDVGARAAERLRDAQAHVSLAVDGLRNRIAERLEPVLTPLLMRFAEWLAMSPAVAHAVDWLGIKVGELGRWIEGGGIQRFGETIHGWLEPIGSVVHFLGGDGGVLGAVEGLMALMVGSFALKVIAPWFALARAILAATMAVGRFGLASAGLGGKGLLGLLGRAGIAGLGGFATHEALKTIDPNDDMGAWIDRNVPGAAAIDNFASRFGLGRSYEQQRQHDQRQEAPRAGQMRAPGQSQGTPSASHAAFYQTYGPAAEKVAAATGVDRDVILGHWAQETAFGRSVHDFNVGNMQAGRGYEGRTVVRGDTHADGSAYQTRFRAYDNPEQFADDYISLLRRRYPGALSAGSDALRFGQGLKDGGYMENPNGARDIANTAGRVHDEIGRLQQSAPMQPPSAKGEALALASPDRRDDSADPQKVHLHITGDGRYRAQVLESSSAVKVEGPLVERPGLLGAQA